MLGASPERQNVVQTPGELVAAVRIDGLEQAADNPGVHGQDVEVFGNGAPHDGNTDAAESENHDLNRRGILGSQTERCRVLVVNLVDILVEEGAGVHGAMSPVMPCVLQNEEDCDLVGHLEGAREGDAGLEAEVLAHGVEKPDLGELDCEVGEED